MPRSSAVIQVRLDNELKNALFEASARAKTTPSRAVRELIETFVRDSYRAEARRQSRIVAESADSKATMDEIEQLQAWMFD